MSRFIEEPVITVTEQNDGDTNTANTCGVMEDQQRWKKSSASKVSFILHQWMLTSSNDSYPQESIVFLFRMVQ